MDFFIAGSNDWGSSPVEEAFISSYFSENTKIKKIFKESNSVDQSLLKLKLKKKRKRKNLPIPSQELDLNKPLKDKKEKNKNSLSLIKKNLKDNDIVKQIQHSSKLKKKKKSSNTSSEMVTNKSLKDKKKAKNIVISTSFSDSKGSKISEIKKKRKLNASMQVPSTKENNELATSFSDNKCNELSKVKKKRKLNASIKVLSTEEKDELESSFSDNDSIMSFKEEADDSDSEELRNEILVSEEYKALQNLIKNTGSDNLDSSAGKISKKSSLHTANKNSDKEEIGANDLSSSSVKQFFVSQSNVANKSPVKLTKYEQIAKADSLFCRNPKVKQSTDPKILSNSTTSLKTKAQEKLQAARFRFLNQRLYTETGEEAFKYFLHNKEDFNDYHLGYSLQVSKWPLNPINRIITDIRTMKEAQVIADMGCGEAKIAQTFKNRNVSSFDLVAMNDLVTSCNISKVPLKNESVDIAVFCLSLMGTNLKDYLCEAFRILKSGGTLKIAEVESRFDDTNRFIDKVKSIGFSLKGKITKEKMFVFMDFVKVKKKLKCSKVPDISLKPCLYKKR